MESDILQRYGFWAVVILLLIKEFAPAIRTLLEGIAPEYVKRKKTADEKMLEIQELEIDIREREVIAREQQARLLVIINNDQQHFKADIEDVKQALGTIVSAQMIEAQNIALILDRSIRIRREDYSQPNNGD